MFRGEPLAIWTNIFALLQFHLTLVLGLVFIGFLELPFRVFLQSHYFFAFFGWIGFLIFGSQLQFYKAITGNRKYTPEWARWVYLISLGVGQVLIFVGISLRSFPVVLTGELSYFLGVIIHLIWLTQGLQSNLFKFPLNYFYVAHLFFTVTFLFMMTESLQNGDYRLVSKTVYTHILGVGWISMTLQGAMIRIFPMFLGKTIDRESRKYLWLHFWFTTIVAISLSIAFVWTNIVPDWYHALTGTAWLLGWVWTLSILIRSVANRKRDTLHKFSLLFMGSGIILFLIGSLLGLTLPFTSDWYLQLRRLHIHYTLLFGLSILMLGALHRILIFQIYTVLYTGRREQAPSMESLFQGKKMYVVGIWSLLQLVGFTWGFLATNYSVVAISAVAFVLGLVLYDSILVPVIIRYWRERKDAIPIDKKPTEV